MESRKHRRLLIVLAVAQLAFTASDLLARAHLQTGFTATNLLGWWLALYFGLRSLGVVGKIYVLSPAKLGRSAGLFAAVSVILSNTLGVLALAEVLTTAQYVGVALSIAALVLSTVRRKLPYEKKPSQPLQSA